MIFELILKKGSEKMKISSCQRLQYYMNFNYTFIIRKYSNILIVLSNTYFEENIFKFVLYENIKFAF